MKRTADSDEEGRGKGENIIVSEAWFRVGSVGMSHGSRVSRLGHPPKCTNGRRVVTPRHVIQEQDLVYYDLNSMSACFGNSGNTLVQW